MRTFSKNLFLFVNTKDSSRRIHAN